MDYHRMKTLSPTPANLRYLQSRWEDVPDPEEQDEDREEPIFTEAGVAACLARWGIKS